MGLENLKSAFSNIDSTDYNGISVHGPPHPADHSQLDIDKTPPNNPVENIEVSRLTQLDSIFANLNVVDFIGGENSYGAPFMPPVEGFTSHFNQGGYTFPNGEIGNSKLIHITSNLAIGSDNIQFTPGLGFEGGHWTLQVATEGIESSLYYINGPFGPTIGVSGAFHQFGELGEALSNFGLDLPPIDFSASIEPFGSILKYSDTVFESITAGNLGIAEVGQIPTDADATPPAAPGGIFKYKNPYRGVAFQVLGPGNNPGGRSKVPEEDKYSHFIGQVELERVNSQLEGREFNESFVTPTPLDPSLFITPTLDFSYQDAVINETTPGFFSPLDWIDPGKLELQIPPILQWLGHTFFGIGDEVNWRNLLGFRLDNLELKSDIWGKIGGGLENAFSDIYNGINSTAFGGGMFDFGQDLIDRFRFSMFGGASTAELVGDFSGMSPGQQLVHMAAFGGTMAISKAIAPIIIGTTILDTLFSGNDDINAGLKNGSGIYQNLSGFGNQVIVPAADAIIGGVGSILNVASDIITLSSALVSVGVTALSPIAGLNLPIIDLSNPFGSVLTNYGGQGAVLNSSAPVRPTGAYSMRTGTGYMRLQDAPQPSMGQRDDPVQLTEFQYPNSDTEWMNRRIETMGNIEHGFTGHMRPSSSRKLNEELSEENKRGEFPKWDPDIGAYRYSDSWSVSNNGIEVRTGKINGEEQELNTLKSSGPTWEPDPGSSVYTTKTRDAQSTNDVGVGRLGSSKGKHSHNAQTDEDTIPIYDKEVHPEMAASFEGGHVPYGSRAEFKDDTKNKSILANDPENNPIELFPNVIPVKSLLLDEDGDRVADDDRLYGTNVESLNYNTLINGDSELIGGYNRNNKYGAVASSFYPNLKKGTGIFPDTYKLTGGDAHTTAPMLKGDTLDEAVNAFGDSYVSQDVNYVDSGDYGMPFYFKDMRDNSFIVFRAYIDGVVDTVGPTWNPVKYVGRSEPTYIYDSAEREISLNLHLAAQSGPELDAIYGKLRRLTSLCYPEYKADVNLQNKIRMKAPLTKLRVGELFGNSKDELTGFIKSLSYSVPDQTTWEFRKGQRVPKLIDATLTYQVIHGTPPHKNSIFHGYIGQMGVSDITT